MTSIVFMGTPEFSAPILQSLVDKGYDVKAVVTQPTVPLAVNMCLQPHLSKKVAVANKYFSASTRKNQR